MVWLLIGLVALGLLALGLVALGLVALGLVGRLRRNRSEVESLRRSIDDGTARLRAGQQQLRAWRARRGSEPAGPTA